MSLEAKKRAAADFERLELMKQLPSLLTPQAAPAPSSKPNLTDLTGKWSYVGLILTIHLNFYQKKNVHA